MGIQAAIRKVSQKEDLTFEEAHAAMRDIMEGVASQAQIGAYLMGLRLKGETVTEIAGSAAAMREVSRQLPMEIDGAVDTCGTGGDGSNTFNISTTASFVVAGAGVPVAKHGNRGASSKSGSADVLSALGVNLELTPEKVAQCIQNVGIGFMFAVAFHPAMKHAIGPRREMGVRTVFNVLGPLTNPANVRRQVMGVYAKNLTESIANVFKELGSEHVLVVHGEGGLDELTTTGVNYISELMNGSVKSYTLDPAELGLKRVTLAEIQGGEPADNARITQAVLSGQGTQPQREIVLLNAAAGLMAADKVKDISEGLRLGAHILDSGKALEKLDGLVKYSQEIAS